MGFWERLWWAMALRCPKCRAVSIFESGWRMHERCPNCDLRLNREPGYFVGGMEINVFVTCAAAIGVFFGAGSVTALSHGWLVTLACATGALFPLAFYRHARSLWISLDRFFDPTDHWWET